MKAHQINATISQWVPREVPTAALGITVAATSGVALQYLASTARCFPTLTHHFLNYSCSAALVAGIVMAVYSAVRLAQKSISEKTPLRNVIVITAGCLSTALAQTIGHHFWTIAPSFMWPNGHTLAYCIGTNLAWQISALTGLAGIVFTAYAAYRISQTLLSRS